MTIAYFDCFNGAAGDMLLAALLDAGLELAALENVLARLPLDGYRIEYLPGSSHGITGSRLRIQLTTPQPARDWRTIRTMLETSALPEQTRRWVIGAFRRLARAEGRVHGVTEEHVHFHEVGAVDSIVDMVGVCAGLELLGVERIFASPLPTGSGWVQTQHGRMPVPAPATLALLTEVEAPVLPSLGRGELVTPTAAALLAELATFAQPPMHIERVGYGFGTKEFGWINGLRVWIGRATDDGRPATGHSHAAQHGHDHAHEVKHEAHDPSDPAIDSPAPTDRFAASEYEQVVELRCNLDDVTGEVVGSSLVRLLAAGALDAWAAPLTMKKGRPALQLSSLVRPADVERLAELLLRETPTLGVRWERMERRAAQRTHTSVTTPWGTVRVKHKLLDGARVGAAPEYDDCAALARAHGVPLLSVYAAALQDHGTL